MADNGARHCPRTDGGQWRALADDLTPGEHHDAPELPPELPSLLAVVKGPVAAVCADGAYDALTSHAAILARGATLFVGELIPRINSGSSALPPRKGAAISPPTGMKDPPPTRGEAVRRITEAGRKEWKQETGYHRRSLSETGMYRTKSIIGPTLKSRTLPNQKTEAAVGVQCLNQFTGLGMPISIKIA